MNITPTETERAELAKRSRAATAHFTLLVVLICLASFTFLFPDGVAPWVTLVLGILILVVGASTLRLQHFQKCPRCEVRISRTQRACVNCDLEYSVTVSSEDDENSS